MPKYCGDYLNAVLKVRFCYLLHFSHNKQPDQWEKVVK